MRLRYFILAACGVALAGCKDTFVAPTPVPARVRIINSTYQTTDGANTAATAVPRAIDVLVDSSLEKGVASLAPNTATGESGSGDGYLEVGIGLHTFLARLAAPATPNTSLYSNTATPRGEFLPKMHFTPNTYYTLIVGGVAPTTGRPSPNTFLTVDRWSMVMPLVDDVARPPLANGQRQARYRMVNAAPFGAGGTNGQLLYGYLTEGTNLPTAQYLGTLSSTVNAEYRRQSVYRDVTAGSYVFTLTTTSTPRVILAQQVVEFKPGEIRSFIVQNTGYTTTSSATSHKLTVLLDFQHE